ncbi:uncharacterized protein BXIN_1604 [Babesia sp. Xinjiang]|uniref:uncharacterized protein n=1 Tax=Babesia sp. Xinjiang TaxID=462227 RepID=UPI000A265FA6|nr:uncharacterized protein BXIN_1604 [Babesia sp. Xinjiang]ORM39885.1 hypothetical protein BXIN_1604 [Babesia sp. Xinjiang]
MDTTAISTACLLEVLWDTDFDVLDLPLSLEMVEAASDITEEMVEIVRWCLSPIGHCREGLMPLKKDVGEVTLLMGVSSGVGVNGGVERRVVLLVRVDCGRVDAVVVGDDCGRDANARACEGGPVGRVVRIGGDGEYPEGEEVQEDGFADAKEEVVDEDEYPEGEEVVKEGLADVVEDVVDD